MSEIKFSVTYILAYLLSVLINVEIWVFKFKFPWFVVLCGGHLACGLLSPVLYIAKVWLGAGSAFHKFIIRHPNWGYALIPVTVALWGFNWSRDLVQKAEITIFAEK